MDISINQFPSLTGKTNTGLRQWPLILASLHEERIFLFHIQKEKISKYWDNGVGKWVFIFLPSIAILRIGPLKNFGFKFQPPCQSNNYPQRKLYQINPKLTSIIRFLKDLPVCHYLFHKLFYRINFLNPGPPMQFPGLFISFLLKGKGIVKLNLINHLVGFISCQICLYFSN